MTAPILYLHCLSEKTPNRSKYSTWKWSDERNLQWYRRLCIPLNLPPIPIHYFYQDNGKWSSVFLAPTNMYMSLSFQFLILTSLVPWSVEILMVMVLNRCSFYSTTKKWLFPLGINSWIEELNLSIAPYGMFQCEFWNERSYLDGVWIETVPKKTFFADSYLKILHFNTVIFIWSIASTKFRIFTLNIAIDWGTKTDLC